MSFTPTVIKENLLAWLATRAKRKIQLVSTQHGMPESTGRDHSILKRLQNWFSFRLLSCFFDRTVVVSEEMRRLLVCSYGFSAERVTVVYNGICFPENVIEHNNKRMTLRVLPEDFFPSKIFHYWWMWPN